MDAIWFSTIKSLDTSLAQLRANVAKMNAALPVDVSEILEQLKSADESAGTLRSLLHSELPSASWDNRQELELLIGEVQKQIEVREMEQRRSKLLALANELALGNITHRRAVRVKQLNELREDAIAELRAMASSGNGSVKSLPGPDSETWIAWACALKEPEDIDSLQTLRTEFAHLDEFVANLEPNMWVAKAETTA